MQKKVRQRQYVVTLHADEEMDEDELTIFDMESAILTGKIIERQKDTGTKEWKYLVRGKTVDEETVIIVVNKFGKASKLVIITVYVDND
ncbi:MAG: DUF4258 domain-containing protein [Chloroflexi bacterium]|nr:DUF4258 domain-containing protein [Chloroflexota bacterium]